MLSYIVTFFAGAVVPLILAGFGGHLATLAWTGTKQRNAKIFIWALTIVGIVLFAVTQVFAFRSDARRDGADARRDIADARRDSEDARRDRDEEIFRSDVRGKLNQIVNEPDISKRRAAANSLAPTVAPKSAYPDKNGTSGGAPLVSAPPPADPYDALDVRIQILLNNIWSLDSGYASAQGRTARSIERHSESVSAEEANKFAGDRTRTRDAGYHDLQPEIARVRHLIQAALKLTLHDIDADDHDFRALNAKAQIPTPVPTVLDADTDVSYKFLAIRQYFVGLDKKLGYKLLNEDKLLEPSFSGPYR